MGRIIATGLVVFIISAVLAKDTTTILIVGVFHFANPRMDAVKVDQIDVTTRASQQYLERVTKKLAQFRPTAILQEFIPKKESELNAEYDNYLIGNFELGKSEKYQLGFRIAKASEINYLHGIDEWGPKMKFGEFQNYMTRSEPKALKKFQDQIAAITAKETQAHSSMTLQQLLVRYNEAEADRENKAIYLSTNSVGAGDGFVGADAAAGWWNRNFRMYANIQKHVKPGARLIVIVGAGHAAILRDLADIDPDVSVEAVMPYLRLR